VAFLQDIMIFACSARNVGKRIGCLQNIQKSSLWYGI